MREVALLCPVRGCGEPLGREERTLRCPRGHAFDLARSGYINLLQPQDSRSRTPGDSREAALARRRLFAAGLLDPLLSALEETAAGLPLPPEPAILDVGCGEGTVLARLAQALGGPAHGVDISAPAIDLAARAYPEATWIVTNADRALPYAAGSFDLALSITARQRPAELRCLLSPAGRLVVAVPGPDDLLELRETIGGERQALPGGERIVEGFAPDFALVSRRALSWTVPLDATGSTHLADLLAASYRGARHAARERLAGIAALEVTMSREILAFRPA